METNAISPSLKHRLSRIIDKINNRLFDETDIRSLLIEIRDYLPKDSLIRDIAHFIAHPQKKDRGLIHKDLALFAYKIKRAVGIDKQPIKIKTMTKEFYEMTIYGIEQLGRDLIINDHPVKSHKAIKLFKERYNPDGRMYHLKEPILRPDFDILLDIIKNVFGAILVKPFLTKSSIINMFNDAISSILPDYDQDIITSKSTEIMICLMSVIQNVDFLLFDKSRAYLKWQPFSLNDKGETYDNISLLACCEGPEYVGFSFIFVSAECESSEYGISLHDEWHIKRQYYAERDSAGILRLKLTGETMPFI